MQNKVLPKKVIFLGETNFILDVAFQQDANCEYLFRLADEHRMQMVLPEYAVAEAEGTGVQRLLNQLRDLEPALSALRQFRRSAYHEVDDLIRGIEQLAEKVKTIEIPLVVERISNLQQRAAIIPLTPEILLQVELREAKQIPPFKKGDIRIYESILKFAAENQGSGVTLVFLTRDRKDFDHLPIHAELQGVEVELFFSAGDCVRRIRELLGFG